MIGWDYGDYRKSTTRANFKTKGLKCTILAKGN